MLDRNVVEAFDLRTVNFLS